MGTVAVVATAVSAVVSAYGAYSSGEAQKAAADSQAKIASYNAQVAQNNATTALQEGDANATQAAMKSKAQLGGIIAAQAANGIDVNSGSAVAVQSSARMEGQQDALSIRTNAARQAYSYDTQAASYTMQASLDTQEGENAETAGYIGTATSLLQGASSAYSSYAKADTAGSGNSTSVSGLTSYSGWSTEAYGPNLSE